jgi:D-glycero-alpha-D-manno-heptose-7-phosphate kinase
MIISRTPYRVSFFGGGTDYPQWSRQHGGAVLGMAIDKYCYISLRYLPPFFEHRHRIVYSKIETVNAVDEVQHPAVRAILTEMGVVKGLEIHHDGDLPARSGIGSSSAFTVGLLNALYALEGRRRSKKDLANDAIRIEQQVLAEHVGSQDQIWAAYGGMNRIDFHTDGSFSLRSLVMRKERVEAMLGCMRLYFTGFARYASEVARKQIENLKAREASLHLMHDMVDEAESILTDDRRDLDELGHLLNEAWMLKRSIASEISTSAIDDIYRAGLDAGALGGKLLGAGGGGFLLFYVHPHRQATLREHLKNLIEIRFDVDRTGSAIVVYSPDGLG